VKCWHISCQEAYIRVGAPAPFHKGKTGRHLSVPDGLPAASLEHDDGGVSFFYAPHIVLFINVIGSVGI